MELLNNNLEVSLKQCKNRFGLKTVLILFDQILERLSNLHSKGYIHRNIKPDNFMMGLGENRETWYLIDFVLAKKFIKNGEIIPFKKGRQMTGPLRYASINSQLGFEQSRRDDLESLGYMMIFFLKGDLPWQNIQAKDIDEKYKMVMKSKLATTINSLAKGLPDEFKDYMNYVKWLDYETEPDYEKLRNMFKRLFNKRGFANDGKFDWDNADEIEEEPSQR